MNDAPWYGEVKARYTASLGEKAQRLRTLFEAYAEAPEVDERREELRSAFHRIHGSAGSYGFAYLGELCGRCEEQLNRLGSPGKASPQDLTLLSEAIDEFCEIVDRECAGG